MDWDFTGLPVAQRYKLLVALVIPRPIAFVSTRSTDGVDNAAPFSFFNVMGEEPPIVVLSMDRRADGSRKDSSRNILETREFVANMVDEPLLERMHRCSVAFPPEVSEFAETGLTPVPASKVAAPRIAESPVSLECRLHTHLPFAQRDLLVGEILWVHVRDGLVDPGDAPCRAGVRAGRPALRQHVRVHARTRRARPERIRAGDAAARTGVRA